MLIFRKERDYYEHLSPPMQMTAVYSCARILAEAIDGLPLHLYHYTDEDGKKKAIDHSISNHVRIK